MIESRASRRCATVAVPFALVLAACAPESLLNDAMPPPPPSGSDVPSGLPAATPEAPAAGPTHRLAGSLSGLAEGRQLVLVSHDSERLVVSANGRFAFTNRVPDGGSYAITVGEHPVGQTCTVAPQGGSAIAADVTDVAVVCATRTVKIGGTVTGLLAGTSVVLRNNGGDRITVSADGTFTFDAPVAYGGSYSVTVDSQPAARICRVSAGSGSSAVVDRTDVSVRCTGFMLYTGSPFSPGLNGWAVGADGALTSTGATASGYTSGMGSGTGLVFGRAGTYAYSIHGSTTALRQWRIGADDSLTQNADLPLVDAEARALSPRALAASPLGDRVYIGGSNWNGSEWFVTEVAIAADGSMTAANTQPIGHQIKSIRVDPLGRFVYVHTANSQAFVFSIGAAGALSAVGPSPVVMGAEPLVFESTGRFAFVTSGFDTVYSVYRIRADGSLEDLALGLTKPSGVKAMRAHPTRPLLYVARSSPDEILVYGIESTGALTSIGAVAAGASPSALAFEPSGQFLLVLGGSAIRSMPIGNDGVPGPGTAYSIGGGGFGAQVFTNH